MFATNSVCFRPDPGAHRPLAACQLSDRPYRLDLAAAPAQGASAGLDVERCYGTCRVAAALQCRARYVCAVDPWLVPHTGLQSFPKSTWLQGEAARRPDCRSNGCPARRGSLLSYASRTATMRCDLVTVP
jgi:hypothetical protein